MPNYVYKLECKCYEEFPEHFKTFDLNMSIEERDRVWCSECKTPAKRQYVFSGLTWAPTAGGMR